MVKLTHCCCCFSVYTGTIILSVVDIVLAVLNIISIILQYSTKKSFQGSYLSGSFFIIGIAFLIIVRLPRAISALIYLCGR